MNVVLRTVKAIGDHFARSALVDRQTAQPPRQKNPRCVMTKVKNKRCWDVLKDVSVDEISRWCLRARGVDRLIVAVRPYIDRDGRVEYDARIDESVLRVFGGSIIRSTYAMAWPGTELIENMGKVYVIRFDSNVAQRISNEMNHLSGWVQRGNPPLPEDLCLYREGDAWPVLVSVTHDGDAWLYDDDPDAAFLRTPTISLPNDLIPPAPRFIVESSGKR
jgi:hypothetical protein